MLLERGLIRIVGKKEEPGRPLLYGTSSAFLSLFNLSGLHDLPNLREFHELNEESQEELQAFDGLSNLADLRTVGKDLSLDAEPAIAHLDDALDGLSQTESTTREALAERGVHIARAKCPKLRIREYFRLRQT